MEVEFLIKFLNTHVFELLHSLGRKFAKLGYTLTYVHSTVLLGKTIFIKSDLIKISSHEKIFFFSTMVKDNSYLCLLLIIHRTAELDTRALQ